MEKEPITIEGLENLKQELKFLKEKKRPEIVNAISEARSHGDLKENAEYHAAKEQQSHNEGRIQEIENSIATANVIDVLDFKFLTTKKNKEYLVDQKKYFVELEVPVMPIKAKDLIENFNLKEGRLLGLILKEIEEQWLNNNFSISNNQVEEIVNSKRI